MSMFPIGHSIYDFEPDAGGSGTVYAVTDHGLYSSSNGAMTWLPLFTFATRGAFEFAQARNDPNTLYLGASFERSGKLYRSSDRGKSWAAVGASDLFRPITLVAIDPFDSKQIYVHDEAGLHKTLNGGSSWADVTPPQGMSSSSFITFDPIVEGHIWAGTGTGNGQKSDLFESSDGGRSWQTMANSDPPPSWKYAMTSLQMPVWKYFLVYPTDPKQMLGITTTIQNHRSHVPGEVISDDGGKTWRDISNIANPKDERTEAVMGMLEWSTADKRVIFGAGEEALYVSRNAGKTWNKALPYPTTLVREIDPLHILAATSLGVFKSSDGGYSWHEANVGLPISFGVNGGPPYTEVFEAFYEGNDTSLFPLESTDGSKVFLGGRGGYWVTADGGMTWKWLKVESTLRPGENTSEVLPRYYGPAVRQLIPFADGSLILNLAAQGPFGTGNAEIEQVGANGTVVPIRMSVPPNQIAASFSDPRALYAGITPGRTQWAPRIGANQFMRSDDRGFSWQTIDFLKDLGPELEGAKGYGVVELAVDPHSSKVCYVLLLVYPGSSLALMKTTDGGASWQNILPEGLIKDAFSHPASFPDSPAEYHLAINPKDAGAILTLNGNLFRYDGSEWRRLPLGQRRINAIAFPPSGANSIYVASDASVLVSNDGGSDWREIKKGLFQGERIHNLVVLNDDTVFAQGDFGLYRLVEDNRALVSRWSELESKAASDPMGVMSGSGSLNQKSISAQGAGSVSALGSQVTSPLASGLTVPILDSPAEGAQIHVFPRRLTLTWKAVPNATSYSVQVDFSDGGGGWSTTATQNGITATSFTFDFIGKTRGRWRVCASAEGKTGEVCSEWREFDYTI